MMTAGYFQSNYLPTDYFSDDYFAEYGTNINNPVYVSALKITEVNYTKIEVQG